MVRQDIANVQKGEKVTSLIPFVSRLKWLFLALAVSLLLVEGVYRFSPLETAERVYSDLWHRLGGVRYTPQHVALVAVDDLSLAQFSEDPLVFWTPLFARACETLQQAGVAVIGIDFLFTGDAEKEAEAAMLAQSVVPVPDIEILKAGHHGSRMASSPDFLNVIRPETTVYSAAAGNSYGHPHKETLINLDNIGAKIYGTDVHGTVVITTDGKTYTIQTGKQAPPVKP